MPSAMPCSTTFVSPPTIGTPALRAAIAIASISLSSALAGNPASRINVAISASGRAAETARSLTVPFTASSPIEPPGKRSGLTTKPSAVVAMPRSVNAKAAPHRRTLGGSDWQSTARTSLRPDGATPFRRRRAPSRFVRRRNAAFCASAPRPSTRGLDGGGVHGVPIVGGAGAFARDHQGADRMLGIAFGPEELALRRLEHALEHFAALRAARIGDAHARECRTAARRRRPRIRA